jgi:hypothetical protein
MSESDVPRIPVGNLLARQVLQDSECDRGPSSLRATHADPLLCNGDRGLGQGTVDEIIKEYDEEFV